MDTSQDVAKEISEIDMAVKAAVPFVLTLQHQAWIDYNALSGLITDYTEDEDKRIRRMTISEFAGIVGVDRKTLQRWRNDIPNFWDLVNKRRIELAPQSRLQMFHEKWYLAALKMNNWQLSEAWAINFDPNYKAPKIKAEIDVGEGLADLMANRRKVIDAEVVDGKDAQS